MGKLRAKQCPDDSIANWESEPALGPEIPKSRYMALTSEVFVNGGI